MRVNLPLANVWDPIADIDRPQLKSVGPAVAPLFRHMMVRRIGEWRRVQKGTFADLSPGFF